MYVHCTLKKIVKQMRCVQFTNLAVFLQINFCAQLLSSKFNCEFSKLNPILLFKSIVDAMIKSCIYDCR